MTSVHIVGHDMGGIVAYAYARQFPRRHQELCRSDTLTGDLAPESGHWIPEATGWRGG